MIIERAFFVNVLIASAIILIFLFIIAWEKRPSLGSSVVYMSISLGAMCIYNYGYAMELSSNNLEEIMRWVRFEHLGIQLISPSCFLFALCMTGNEKKITPARVASLFVFPVLMILATQTLGGLNLTHGNPRLNTSGPISVFIYDKTPLMWASLGYIYLCLTGSLVLFTIKLVRATPDFRIQAALFWIGSLIPFISALFYNLGWSLHNLDYTPFALTFTSILTAMGFLMFRMLDIVPLARDVIYDNLNDGVLVLDNRDYIMDFNRSLEKILVDVDKKTIGHSALDVLTAYPSLVELIKKNSFGSVEFEVNRPGGTFSYIGTLAPLQDSKKKEVGKIVSIHDNTHTKQLLNQLEELAARDSLTGMYNRRSFDQLAAQKMHQFQLAGGAMSLIMLDLDHFKRVNDTYSHSAGDMVLKTVTEICRKLLRQADILGRYGGEEFLVLLPGIDSSAAAIIAERLRQGIEQQNMSYEGHSFTITASLGVASTVFPGSITLEELFHCADSAVYQAKKEGRNRIYVCPPLRTR